MSHKINFVRHISHKIRNTIFTVKCNALLNTHFKPLITKYLSPAGAIMKLSLYVCLCVCERDISSLGEPIITKFGGINHHPEQTNWLHFEGYRSKVKVAEVKSSLSAMLTNRKIQNCFYLLYGSTFALWIQLLLTINGKSCVAFHFSLWPLTFGDL